MWFEHVNGTTSSSFDMQLLHITVVLSSLPTSSQKWTSMAFRHSGSNAHGSSLTTYVGLWEPQAAGKSFTRERAMVHGSSGCGVMWVCLNIGTPPGPQPG